MNIKNLLVNVLRYALIPILAGVLFVQNSEINPGHSLFRGYVIAAGLAFIPWYFLTKAIGIIHGELTPTKVFSKKRFFFSWVILIVISCYFLMFASGGSTGELIIPAILLSLVPLSVYYGTELLERRMMMKNKQRPDG